MEDNGAPQVVDNGTGGSVVRMRRFLVMAHSPSLERSCYAQTMMSESHYKQVTFSPESFFGSYLVYEVLAEEPDKNALWVGLSEWVDMPVEP